MDVPSFLRKEKKEDGGGGGGRHSLNSPVILPGPEFTGKPRARHILAFFSSLRGMSVYLDFFFTTAARGRNTGSRAQCEHAARRPSAGFHVSGKHLNV